jgi:hypothetical protein
MRPRRNLATIHLASFPSNLAPDIREAAVSHIARVYSPTAETNASPSSLTRSSQEENPDSFNMEAGIRLLELTRNMHRLFKKQQADEKRRLLNFVVSNSIWKGGEIVPVWRQPFDIIAVANQPSDSGTRGAGPKNGPNENWLPEYSQVRTGAPGLGKSWVRVGGIWPKTAGAKADRFCFNEAAEPRTAELDQGYVQPAHFKFTLVGRRLAGQALNIFFDGERQKVWG